MLALKYPKRSTPVLRVALVGNPNSGKSTLFNRLTGLNQYIGNWPGVTVEQKNGCYYDTTAKLNVNVVDLPGCYSLESCQDTSLDERVSCDYIAAAQDVVFVNVIDALHLRRDLYLTLQLLESGTPIIVALNCMDLAKDSGLQINVGALAQMLGCPVIPIVAKTGNNLIDLKRAITQPVLNNYQPRFVDELDPSLGDEEDLQIAMQRAKNIQNIMQACVRNAPLKASNYSSKIDSVVLHKFFGPLIFIAVMYSLFSVAVNLGGYLQGYVDQFTEVIFVNNTASYLQTWGTPSWLLNILAFGIGKGLNITLTFVPVLTAMFVCLGLLESSGYMTRAAFMVDRIMGRFGLPGKAFVPMIVGFGCNVPAIMGSRILADRRERILTIMMTPFMSCSARLAIYAIFVAAFFPIGGQNIIFSLYLIGVLIAAVTGLVLRVPDSETASSISLLEMPDYRWPDLTTIWQQAWRRLRSFLIKAGAIIISLCILLNGLGSDRLENIGKRLTPAFAPIGISAENWPATVGLITGLLAKEAVVGTLTSVYSSAAGQETLAESEMVKRFGGPVAAYAYLLFTLLYFPCVSVVAVIARELNKRWAAFSVVWSTGLAYIVAALYFQIATWSGNKLDASLWISGLLLFLLGIFAAARWFVAQDQKATKTYKPIPSPVVVIDQI